MEYSKPEFRCPTGAAITALASRFKLPNTPDMQDWEWEVANPKRIDEFLSAYKNESLGDDEKFTLLEILLQSFEDSKEELTKSYRWQELLKLIENNFQLHAYSVWYWADFENNNLDEEWRVTLFMRKLYKKQTLVQVHLSRTKADV